MAVKTDDKIITPESTGAVQGPPETESWGVTDDNTSTGAVEYSAPGTTVVTHYDEPITVNYPTPGPVTMTVSWLPEEEDVKAESKVVDAPVRKPTKTSGAKVETK
jgi:hypothetical protein